MNRQRRLKRTQVVIMIEVVVLRLLIRKKERKEGEKDQRNIPFCLIVKPFYSLLFLHRYTMGIRVVSLC